MPPLQLSRRAVLLGGAGAVLLAACGGGGGDGDGEASEATGDFTLVQFFGQDVLVAGVAQRAPFGLGDREGVVTGDVPESLTFTLELDGREAAAPAAVTARREGLPRPYYPFTFTVDEPGIYTAVTEVDGARLESTVQVNPAADVALPQIGGRMIPVDTPTPADPRGVNPICTREPACPLHDVTLTEALAEGRPIAFLVSTPKFCQVAICGPVLDVLLAAQADHPDVHMLHAEVFTDETTSSTTEAVNRYGLTFEPCLFLADSDGTVAERLDFIYDEGELATALDRLVS